MGRGDVGLWDEPLGQEWHLMATEAARLAPEEVDPFVDECSCGRA